MTDYIRCHIKTMSPIHLGCDEVYDPLTFAVDDGKKRLVVFDTAAFLSQLDQPKLASFSNICKKGTPSSILEIYKFFAREKPTGREITVSESFVNHYKRTLSLSSKDDRTVQQELNRFVIERTAFLPTTDRPYLPGSAVKGSLRTAYLNLLMKEKHAAAVKTDNGRKLEEYLLEGSFDTDPLRFLKVSDFMPVGEVKTKIVYAVNEKKRLSEFAARGPYQILEVIEPGAVFQGAIAIEQPSPKAKIRTPLTLQAVWRSLKEFYGLEFQREEKELERINRKHSLGALDENEFLLRLGRHSGAECVTIAAARAILIRGARGAKRTEKGATTLWLACDAQTLKGSHNATPFGWASLRQTDPDTQKTFSEQEVAWRETMLKKRPQIEIHEKPTVIEPPRVQRETEEWPDANVTWNPGRSEFEARYGQKKAAAKDMNLVAEGLRDKLKKKKFIQALVTVRHEGGDLYTLLSVGNRQNT